MGIADQLDLPDAEAWRPEPGDRVIGKVVGLDERQGDYEPYPVVTIQTSTNELVAVHGFHSVLKNELAKLAPQVGDEVGIVYKGKTEPKTKGGNEYENYKVVIERGDGSAPTTPDWAAHQASAKAEMGEDEEPF